MKTVTEIPTHLQPVPVVSGAIPVTARATANTAKHASKLSIFLHDTIETFKLRVTAMVVLTAWAGFHLGSVQFGIFS
ncbi:MAG TPA: hypothetical protein VMU62_02775, partial [Acidobacteriaceae bacterium]|nr:hypothetical protein [Acidobacteriaceae bacterium]